MEKIAMLIEKTREMCVSKSGFEVAFMVVPVKLENRIREEIKDYGN